MDGRKRVGTRWIVVAGVAAVVGLGMAELMAKAAGQLGGQTGSLGGVRQVTPIGPAGSVPPPLGDNPDLEIRQESRRRHAQDADRQRRMVSDSQRLQALAGEVNTAVNDSTSQKVPADVIRKTEEIEKLAHGVRERMKGQ